MIFEWIESFYVTFSRFQVFNIIVKIKLITFCLEISFAKFEKLQHPSIDIFLYIVNSLGIRELTIIIEN